ncbi:MAG: ubiquinone/menaquinone biosynthesis methyltransferase [Anaerolineales bacterium]|nr:ubiquinone/menaquinone biosynthesis methyltransferase [Anaerolineales bacterium]
MANLTGPERARYVQEMFTRIAPRYDLMNRLMTLGQDVSWRREVVRRAGLAPGARLLDLGAGTGDLARDVVQACPDCMAVAADFTLGMMLAGRARIGEAHTNSRRLLWSGADALHLPFPAGTFDAVISGFLMRNVIDLPRALLEQGRVLKQGGRIIILDTTRPPENVLSPLLRIHLNVVIPNLGRIVTGEGDAYRYLPQTTSGFLQAEQLAAQMVRAGFHQVGFRRLMFGTVAIHWGVLPALRAA